MQKRHILLRGLANWIFEIGRTRGEDVPALNVEISKDLAHARSRAAEALAFANGRMAAMVQAIA